MGEYYMTMNRVEALAHATTWINFKNIMLSQRSQTQRVHIVQVPLYYISRISESLDTKQTGGCQGLEGEGSGL